MNAVSIASSSHKYCVVAKHVEIILFRAFLHSAYNLLTFCLECFPKYVAIAYQFHYRLAAMWYVILLPYIIIAVLNS